MKSNVIEFIDNVVESLNASILGDLYYNNESKTTDQKLYSIGNALKLEKMPWLKNQQEKENYLSKLEEEFIYQAFIDYHQRPDF